MWDSMIDQVWRCESSQSQCQLTTKYTAYIQELYVWETHKSNTLTQYLYLSMTFGYFYTKLGVTKYQEDDLLHCTCLHLYQTVCLHPVEFPFAQEVILICNKQKKKRSKAYSHHQQRAGHRWPPPCSCSCCYSGTANEDRQKKHNEPTGVQIISNSGSLLPLFITDTCHSHR